MFIKEVIIDGFKSYAQRTVISGFDELFNAITGLNGSGKSNILDSICFLLGITNLSQVRAMNLQELVYKNGQAGVTKASVTITWDNSDKRQSPVGYESWDEIVVTRQVVIGGRNKYLINGVNATNQRVQDLFRSVQLNVNNPHFLIMQGRITKVLNMKPPEILSMIEEAAGTKMYETKKASAERTIEKKESKLQEINTILAEEITPTLAKLKEERSAYMEYTKLQREVEYLTKLYVAHQFVTAEATRKRSAQEQQDMTDEVQSLKSRTSEIEQLIKDSLKEMAELEKKKDAESNSGLKKLEEDLTSATKVVAKAESVRDNCRSTLNAEKKKQKALGKSLTEAEQQHTAKERDVCKLHSQLEKLRTASEQDTNALQKAKEHFQAISQGLSSSADGQAQTLAEQLMGYEKQVSDARTEHEQATTRLKAAQEDLKQQESSCKSTEQDHKRDMAAMETVRKQCAKLQADLKKLDFHPEKTEEMTRQREKLSRHCDLLHSKLQDMEARFPNLHFGYTDPKPGFDRSKVHGLVAKLIRVKDRKHAAALEVAAGGKLYHVVLADEQTGKLLLEKGKLQKRHTFIPLTKISRRTISPEVVQRAQQLVGKDNVATAISLVDFAAVDQPAMEFVFGSTLVCRTMEQAKKVCFDERVKTRTVTWEGDVFDPAGTLTGGSRPSADRSLLAQLQEVTSQQMEFDKSQKELAKLDEQLSTVSHSAGQHQELEQQLFLTQRKAEQLQERIESSTHHQQLEKLKQLRETIDGAKAAVQQSKEVEKTAVARCKEVQGKMKEAKSLRERELKEAEQAMAKCKGKAENSRKEMKTKQQEADELQLEAESLKQDMENLKEQIAAMDKVLEGCQKQLDEHQAAVDEAKATAKEAEGRVKERRKILQTFNKDIAECARKQKELAGEKGNVALKQKELEHSVQKQQRDCREAAQKVEQLMSKYEWIDSERQFFGQPNSAYDFKANDPVEAGRRLAKLQDQKEKLSRNVNMRAMNMLGQAEEKYQDLMKKRKIVEDDKAKIARVIEELDEKKSEALLKAFHQVNKDFSSIFGTLLPGSKARLVPPEGMSALDGLEFRVAFGDVWKENLSELSGGQRSLVALSLILAMLLFKPAPLYILDEIDAALDLSHTQNIGQMLRTHFRNSQFIVVSLKDGMFNNANVLFKTKFVDGVSTVTRHVQASSRLQTSAVQHQSGTTVAQKRKRLR